MTCPHPQCRAVRGAAEELVKIAKAPRWLGSEQDLIQAVAVLDAALAQESVPVSISTTRVHSPAQGGEARAEEDRSVDLNLRHPNANPACRSYYCDGACDYCPPAPSTKEKPHDKG